ncbi:glycosyltransferase family 39 protein [Roseibium salinum]|nr:glycosyltransferase family 39 protein [Roseibium salinum]
MAGCGLLSKYSVLFLGAGIVLWLAWVPAARRWWGAWQLWAGGAIAIMCFSPVLYWNHAHEWASFYKQFGRAANGGYTAKYIFEFLGALIGLANPLIAILAALGAVKLFWGLRAREIAPSLLLLTVLPFLLYLLYHSLHARVQANWPAPLFPAFALMAAVFVAGLGPDRTFWRRFAAGGASFLAFWSPCWFSFTRSARLPASLPARIRRSSCAAGRRSAGGSRKWRPGKMPLSS